MAFKMKPKFHALAESPRYAQQERQDLGKYNVIDDIAGKSPAKKVPGPGPVSSPAKQVNRDDGVQVDEVPAVVGEEVKKAAKFVKKKGKRIGKWFKKQIKKVGDVTLTKTKKEKIEKQKKKLKDLEAPTKQTSKQRKNLPDAIVKAIEKKKNKTK
tara:strand:- start:143 stop:607 length:465 start_codon:yes stop_codon:yes gene_type:complete